PARAGATGALPAAPAQVPAAGGPSGAASAPTGEDGGSQLSDEQVLDPNVLARVFQQPPPEAPPQQSGLGKQAAGGPEEMLRSELAPLELVGDVQFANGVLYVDWRDKKRVTEAI